MADSGSPFRLAAPAHQMYDTSAGEQSVLRGITPETMGMMYPFLLGQRTDAANAQEAYGSLLQSVNRQQQQLAAGKLANDELESRRKTVLGLVQHGNLPVSSALGATELPGLANFLTPQQRALGVMRGDEDTHLMNQGRALEAAGSGLRSGVEAGVIPNPGQAVAPGPAGMLGVRSTTGAPLDLSVAALRERSAGAQAGRPQFGVNYNPLSQETVITGKVGTPAEALDLSRYFRNGYPQGDTNGGNMSGSRGAGQAAASNQAPRTQQGNPAPARSVAMPQSELRALEAKIGGNIRIMEQNGRRVAVGDRGTATLPNAER